METPEKPLDRRMQPTRQLLHDASFALLIERGYKSITVGDIAERANIGRTTFYFHYQDKDELLRASVKAMMSELQMDVSASVEEHNPYQMWSVRVFEYVA